MIVHPIPLKLYLGRLWQAENRASFALEPMRLCCIRVPERAKLVLVELRGGKLGRRKVADGWRLPFPAALFATDQAIAFAGSPPFDRDFPRPRTTWWPGERIVVEFEGGEPGSVAVIATRKEFGR